MEPELFPCIKKRLSPENSPDMLAVEAEFMLNRLLSVN